MTRFVVPDHHFTHDNIVEYCDRPFTSVGAMHDTMVTRFHEAVGPDDTLVHLGDVAMDMRDGSGTIEWLGRLSESTVLVRGNHDTGIDPEDAPFPVVDANCWTTGRSRSRHSADCSTPARRWTGDTSATTPGRMPSSNGTTAERGPDGRVKRQMLI